MDPQTVFGVGVDSMDSMESTDGVIGRLSTDDQEQSPRGSLYTVGMRDEYQGGIMPPTFPTGRLGTSSRMGLVLFLLTREPPSRLLSGDFLGFLLLVNWIGELWL